MGPSPGRLLRGVRQRSLLLFRGACHQVAAEHWARVGGRRGDDRERGRVCSTWGRRDDRPQLPLRDLFVLHRRPFAFVRTVRWELFSNRGFARRLDIHASYLQKCSSEAPAPYLALAEPMSCAMHAVAHVQPRAQERVLLVGAGGIGMCVAFLLQHQRALPFDVLEPDQVRLDRLGRAIAPLGRAITVSSGRYDIVIDASGTAGGLRTACENGGPGARLSTMSHLPHGADIGFLLGVRTDITVTFSYLNGERANLRESVELLERHWTPEWDALLEIRPLTDLPAVFRYGATPRSVKVIIDVGAPGTDRSNPSLQGSARDVGEVARVGPETVAVTPEPRR